MENKERYSHLKNALLLLGFLCLFFSFSKATPLPAKPRKYETLQHAKVKPAIVPAQLKSISPITLYAFNVVGITNHTYSSTQIFFQLHLKQQASVTTASDCRLYYLLFPLGGEDPPSATHKTT